MEVEGRLRQARFIEIYQVYGEKDKVGYFSNTVVFEALKRQVLSYREVDILTKPQCDYL